MFANRNRFYYLCTVFVVNKSACVSTEIAGGVENERLENAGTDFWLIANHV